MNIMIINHYAGSDSYGMEFRPFYLGRELVKMGHTVTVIAADCSHLRKKNPIIEESFSEEILDGVKYVFVKTVKYESNSVKRFLNIFSFVSQLNSHSKMLFEKYKPDVIVASSTYPYDVKSAVRIASYGTDVKVCYEIHDIWPLSLIEIYKISPQNPYMQSLQRAENYAYKNADAVISILPDVDRHIKELGFDNVKYKHIPNGVITKPQTHLPAPEHIINEVDRLKKQGKFIVMYLGGFSKANALDELFESAKIMPDNVQIMLVGDGPLKEHFKALAESMNCNNISLMESVHKNQVNKTLTLADLLYIGAKRSELYRFGVGMNKIFDYMLSKRPILSGIEASNDVVTDAGCGVTIEPESSLAIANGVKQLLALPSEELDRMGEQGYNYVLEYHDYKKLAKSFFETIDEL